LTEIAVDKNSTIIFPLPIDIIEPVLNAVKRFGAGDDAVPVPGGTDGNGAVPSASR